MSADGVAPTVSVFEHVVGGEHVDEYGRVNYRVFLKLFEHAQDAFIEARRVTFSQI